jgi:hypothetical protein
MRDAAMSAHGNVVDRRRRRLDACAAFVNGKRKK